MSKKEDIINTALELFNQIGYNATGVDKIIAESNVAKMTFYKYFPSKESLIMECLHHRNINIQKISCESHYCKFIRFTNAAIKLMRKPNLFRLFR